MLFNTHSISAIRKLLLNNNSGIDINDFSDECLCTGLSTASILIDKGVIYKNKHYFRFYLTKRFLKWASSHSIDEISNFEIESNNLHGLFK